MDKEKKYYEQLGYDFDPPFYRAEDKPVVTNTEELKPCPFCGCRDTRLRETAIGNYQNIFYIVTCHDCGVTTNYFRLAAEAKAAWNRRAE